MNHLIFGTNETARTLASEDLGVNVAQPRLIQARQTGIYAICLNVRPVNALDKNSNVILESIVLNAPRS